MTEHEELLAIHAICMDVANCPSEVDGDTLTVKMVKRMAIFIGKDEEPCQRCLDLLERVSFQDTEIGGLHLDNMELNAQLASITSQRDELVGTVEDLIENPFRDGTKESAMIIERARFILTKIKESV